jgi:predicted ArsR family transcriptional regulator
MTARGTDWTEAEVKRLVAAWNAGPTLHDLAGRFCTNYETIRQKLKALRATGVTVREASRARR